MAGKRLGKEDDRHLWPEMLRAIREIQPRWVVGENVLGLVNWSGGLVFHEVQADLEAEGYEVQPFVLPAVSVNAPHRRDRVWFVAYRNDTRLQTQSPEQQATRVKQHGELGGFTPDTDDTRADIGMRNQREWKEGDIIGGFAQPESWEIGGDGNAADTDSIRLEQRKDGEEMGGGQSQMGRQGCQLAYGLKTDGKISNTADTDGIGLRRKSNRLGNPKFVSKSYKGNDWQTFPTQSPICNGNDGISHRLDGITFSKWRQESIKAGGNAVVPQVVLQIFKAIEEYEKMHAQ